MMYTIKNLDRQIHPQRRLADARDGLTQWGIVSVIFVVLGFLALKTRDLGQPYFGAINESDPRRGAARRRLDRAL